MKYHESHIQQSCVKWFRYQFKEPEHLIFAIPNGGARDRVTGAILKAEGVKAGAPDLCILSEGQTVFVELKTDKGKQSPVQLQFQATCDYQLIPYIVVRSLDEFIEQVGRYIKN